MELAERLKLVRDSLGKSQKDMALLINSSLSALQSYESGRQFPGGKVFEALARMGFDSNWLLTGEGEMKRGEVVYPLGESLKNGLIINDDSDDGFVQVPRYKVNASAGGGAVIHSEQIVDYLSFKSDWIRNSLGVSVQDLALINVKGDSMEPSLSNEDLILVDMRTRSVEDNAVYVLQFNGTLLVKRLQRRFDGSVVIMSDNPRYTSETLTGEAVELLKVIGRVVWCGRRM